MADALSPAFVVVLDEGSGLHTATLPGYPDVCIMHADRTVAVDRAAEVVRTTFPEASWNYRAMLDDRDPDPQRHWIGLFEVFYRYGDIAGWTDDNVAPVVDADAGAEELAASLERALHGVRHKPVLRMTALVAATKARRLANQGQDTPDPGEPVIEIEV